MATLVLDQVSRQPCDECPLDRVLVTEREGRGVRVTVLAGCATCEGSTLVVGN